MGPDEDNADGIEVQLESDQIGLADTARATVETCSLVVTCCLAASPWLVQSFSCDLPLNLVMKGFGVAQRREEKGVLMYCRPTDFFCRIYVAYALNNVHYESLDVSCPIITRQCYGCPPLYAILPAHPCSISSRKPRESGYCRLWCWIGQYERGNCKA